MGIGVMQLSNANALDVDSQAKAALENCPRAFRRASNTPSHSTPPPSVADSIREVLVTLAEAIVIVIAVIFLFLLDWRATIIPAVTIPVSLIGTFAFIKVFGFSINSLTLFGITLATGLVVDDAIVVIENVQRHIAMEHSDPARGHLARHGRGHQRRDRHLAGADRGLRAGLVLPRHHRHSLPPVLADHRLRHRHLGLQRAHAFAGSFGHVPARRRGSAPPDWTSCTSGPISRAFAAFIHGADAFVSWRLRNLRQAIHGALQLRYVLLLLFFAGLGATVWIYQHVPTGFIPQEDQSFLMVIVQAPPGSSLAYTTRWPTARRPSSPPIPTSPGPSP